MCPHRHSPASNETALFFGIPVRYSFLHASLLCKNSYKHLQTQLSRSYETVKRFQFRFNVFLYFCSLFSWLLSCESSDSFRLSSRRQGNTLCVNSISPLTFPEKIPDKNEKYHTIEMSLRFRVLLMAICAGTAEKWKRLPRSLDTCKFSKEVTKSSEKDLAMKNIDTPLYLS